MVSVRSTSVVRSDVVGQNEYRNCIGRGQTLSLATKRCRKVKTAWHRGSCLVRYSRFGPVRTSQTAHL